jgi:hypothetical protein
MNEPATSLDRLHDLVLFPSVPWWPPAPGWYGVLALLVLAVAWLAWRFWKRRQANAYRLAALRELAYLEDAAAIGELLRRTALAMAPRPMIAEKTGFAWLEWLAAQHAEPMPDPVRTHLTSGVYGRPTQDDLKELRDYAGRWISRHHRVSSHVASSHAVSTEDRRRD